MVFPTLHEPEWAHRATPLWPLNQDTSKVTLRPSTLDTSNLDIPPTSLSMNLAHFFRPHKLEERLHWMKMRRKGIK